MNSITLFQYSVGFLLLGALTTFLLSRQRQLISKLAFVFAFISSIGIFYIVMDVFLYGPIETSQPLWQLPGLNASLLIRIDFLSAVFLTLVAIISILATLYAYQFLKLPVFKEFSLGRFYSLLLVFFAAVLSIVVMADMFFFFIFWEIMTLSSYALVIFNNTRKEYLKAGFKYFFITHIATVLMFIGAIILYLHGDSFSFKDIGATMSVLLQTNPNLLHLALLFFFIGFSTKAGILPMGDWLPDAYPSAPTPAGAAFAGIMSKLGIYGLLRVFLFILPISSICRNWGIFIAIMGIISIFVGSLSALMQDGAKRLLSFSIIGQMGYLLLGIGATLYVLEQNRVLAFIMLVATLFHLINNVFFKANLFFNAGTIYYRTGSENLSEIGGLGRIMPLTAVTAIIAAFSMSGVPLFAGFSSKWMYFITTVNIGLGSPAIMGFSIVALFISVVTLAYSIKFFGAAFFGKFHPGKNMTNKKTPLSMQIPQIVLAFFAVLPGLLPLLFIKPLGQTVASLLTDVPDPFRSNTVFSGITIPFGENTFVTWNPILLSIVGIIAFLIAFWFFRAGAAPRRVDSTWYCGEEHTDEEVFYPSLNFYKSFTSMLRLRIGNFEQEGVYPKLKYPSITFSEKDILKRVLNIDKWLYDPIVKGFMFTMHKFSALHSGVPHVYLLWLVIGALAAIAVLFLLTANGAQ